ALDRTAVCRRLSKYKPFVIRSTHAAGPNRGPHNRSYWFYKRMAPVSHRYGAGFGVEPPGGDLTLDELRQELFEDASAGANHIFSYFQNYKLLPHTVAEYRRVLRPHERTLVDIGILYPTSQLLLEMSPFPPDQIPFCSAGREYFDYDVVDENMIGWGMLGDYKVLVQTGGKLLEADTIGRIDRWVRAGGLLILRADSPIESVEGDRTMGLTWHRGAGKDVAGGKATLWPAGRGAVARIPFKSVQTYLAAVVAVLREAGDRLPALKRLDGFDGQADGTWTTDFPTCRLRYNVESRRTTIHPRTRRPRTRNAEQ
ncbi:hypothetical protein LCGC14_2656250, partial [marine sediment metagenome]